MVTNEYEYAGFIFLVADGKVIEAKPGQHSAAYKDKHLRAARECYQDDRKKMSTKLTPNERAVLAAVFARSNMGMGNPKPEAVAKALANNFGKANVCATDYVTTFCAEFMESDEHETIFDSEADGWWREFGKRGQNTREYVAKTWPDKGKLFGWST